jgi:predicted nucleic acid-binding protein
MILLDTSILVYAVGDDHAVRVPCRSLVESVLDGVVRASTTVEVIQEFAHVRAHRRPRHDAATRARQFAVGLGPLVKPDDDDLAEALDLFESTPRLGAFDAVLAATARRRGWALASADSAFRKVDGVVHLDPARKSFINDVKRLG